MEGCSYSHNEQASKGETRREERDVQGAFRAMRSSMVATDEADIVLEGFLHGCATHWRRHGTS